MSVAFRRDGDEEHLEPKFDVPIPPGPNRVTPRGLAQIRAKIAELEARLTTLEAETDIAPAKRDLRYWKLRLSTAEPMPLPGGEQVEFGCRVDFTLNGQPRTLTIVGHDEADTATGRIAFTAPLARVLLGAEVGELVDYNGREEAIEIIAITPERALFEA